MWNSVILHRDPDYPCISIVFNHNNALSFLFCYYDNKQKLSGWKPQRKWLGTVLYLDSFMKAAQAAKSFKSLFLKIQILCISEKYSRLKNPFITSPYLFVQCLLIVEIENTQI